MNCKVCNKQLREDSMFCTECGAALAGSEQHVQPTAAPQPQVPQTPKVQVQPVRPAQPPQPQQRPAQPPKQPQPAPPPPKPQPPPPKQQPARPAPIDKPHKKTMPPVLIAVIAAATVFIVGGVGAYFLFFHNVPEKPVEPQEPQAPVIETVEPALPDVSYTYMSKQPEPVIEITSVDSLFPSNYRSLDSLVTFAGYCEYGELDVMVEVEVPGFTQPYSQRVHLGRQITNLRIVPPLILGDLNLDSAKTAQIIISVTDIDTGKILEQESRKLELFSRYDIIWWIEDSQGDWIFTGEDVLAWMTPDAPEIVQLQRDAIDYLDFISNGQLDSLIGYQNYGFFENAYSDTWVQAVSIQGAMSDTTKVRYNTALFTMDSHQRVNLPVDTLNSRSGLCIETSLVIASALQSLGMNVFLVFPPGHAQVAVEAKPNTGDYYLIETTILPMNRDLSGWNSAVQFLSKDEWYDYIDNSSCYIVDAALGEKLGIRALNN